MTEFTELYKAIKQRLRILYAKGLQFEEIETELRIDVEQILQLVITEDLDPNIINLSTETENYYYMDEEEIHDKIDEDNNRVLDLVELIDLSILESCLDLDEDSE